MSNRDRIARAAEEAKLAAAEKASKKASKKATKKTTKKATTTRAKRVAAPTRMKVVWEVWKSSGTTIKTFPYPQKAEAEAAVEALTKSTGVTHRLRATKVPME